MTSLSEHRRPAAAALRPAAGRQEASLFANMIGDRPGGEKGACRVARLIEEDLIVRGWPHGVSCGTEQALAEGFGVGRAVLREAVRILEMRGTARMVPGPGGGLHILELDPRQTADFLVGLGIFLGITADHRRETEAALSRVRDAFDRDTISQRTGAAGKQIDATLDFFGDVVTAMNQMALAQQPAGHRPSVLLAHKALQRSRAGQIVERMLDECTVEQWVRGHRFGSEGDVCFRYGVDRDAFRQAVRMLESAGAAQTACGRGHGLISQIPRSSAVARLVSCLFASSGTHPDAVMTVFHRLTIEIVALSAKKASSADCDAVDKALDRLENALDCRDAGIVLRRIFEAEEAILAIAGNPLLQLFCQSLRGYPSAQLPRDAEMLDAMNRQFLLSSRPVARAFRSNDVGAAMRAQLVRGDAIASVKQAFAAATISQKRH